MNYFLSVLLVMFRFNKLSLMVGWQKTFHKLIFSFRFILILIPASLYMIHIIFLFVFFIMSDNFKLLWTTCPKYVYDSHIGRLLFSIFFMSLRFSFLNLNIVIADFFLFIYMLFCNYHSLRFSKTLLNFVILLMIITISSAYNRNQIPCLLKFFMRFSVNIENKKGESDEPCATPLLILLEQSPSFTFFLEYIPNQNCSSVYVRISSFRIFLLNLSMGTLSYALDKSTYRAIVFVLFFLCFSNSPRNSHLQD